MVAVARDEPRPESVDAQREGADEHQREREQEQRQRAAPAVERQIGLVDLKARVVRVHGRVHDVVREAEGEEHSNEHALPQLLGAAAPLLVLRVYALRHSHVPRTPPARSK